MMSFPANVCCKHGGIPGVKSGVDLGLWRAALRGFTRLITAHNDSDSGSYDGDTMAGSSCEGEQKTGGTSERTVAEIGLSKRFRSFCDNVQDSEHSDGSEKDMGKKTTDAIV